LAKATYDFISEMKSGNFGLEIVAGLDGGERLGTSVKEIHDAMIKLTQFSELVVIYDLGSSKLNSHEAFNLLDKEQQKKVQFISCAFVEGALTAVVSNSGKSAEDLKNLVESQAKIEK
jgi:dihydroxyacetone kinase DhaKLM complex PTS-EIIA-like component DhaM